MAAPQTDLYGFPVTLTELQRAECQQCDALSDVQQPTWMTYIEKDRLPTSDSKIKDMIRKVGRRARVLTSSLPVSILYAILYTGIIVACDPVMPPAWVAPTR